MPQDLLSSIGTSESHGPEVQPQTVGSSESLNENDQSSQPTDTTEEFYNDLKESFPDFMPNLKALASRFIQLSRRPAHLAPLILDFWSLPMSIISSGMHPGPDLFYPLSSLKKQKSGRLARLLLEYSRDLQQRNLHAATSSINDVDPPCVAVIDLDEVPPEIIESGYTVSADSHGHVVMLLFFELFITLVVQLFTPIDSSLYDVFGNWASGLNLSIALCVYAAFRGEGTLTLIRRSNISTPGCAVLLDRDFALILRGTYNVVEAVAENSFRISHPLWSHHLEAWQVGQFVCYEALRGSCEGAPFIVPVVFWLLLHPTSFLTACLPLVPIVAISFFMPFNNTTHIMDYTDEEDAELAGVFRISFRIIPTLLLISAYELVVAKESLPRSFFGLTTWFHRIPTILLIGLFVSSRNYHIRTTKFLDILGHPPIQRWEFDTLAAAATFQCLVLCHGTHRPIKSIDVFVLLDTLIPDQRDVWNAWKQRVADRITYEIDISFAPTLPTFGDERQKRLKELLDQAQIGYIAYREFYDWHVPQHSTIPL